MVGLAFPFFSREGHRWGQKCLENSKLLDNIFFFTDDLLKEHENPWRKSLNEKGIFLGRPRELFQICPTNTVLWQRRAADPDHLRSSAACSTHRMVSMRCRLTLSLEKTLSNFYSFTVLWLARPFQALVVQQLPIAEGCLTGFVYSPRAKILKCHWKWEEQLFNWYRWQWGVQTAIRSAREFQRIYD